VCPFAGSRPLRVAHSSDRTDMFPDRRVGGTIRCSSFLSPHPIQHGTYLLVDEIDGLKRPDHHAELDDSSLLFAPDDVDAIDVFAFDRRFKLEHGGVTAEHGLGVVEPAASIASTSSKRTARS
jgi:hypothetical protein